jgi:hypothetical protein
MNRKSLWRTIGMACMALAAVPALAQDAGEDWDFGRDESRNLSIAAVTFQNFGVAVRCANDRLSVVVSGLPAGSGRRSLGWSLNGAADRTSQWVSARNSTSAFAVWPRSVATDLSHGGRLNVSIADGSRVRRYEVDIPASNQAVGRVFEACGLSLTTPADVAPSGESFVGLRWDRAPRPSLPNRSESFEAGLAGIQCTVQADGSLRGCRAESEFPENGGFGRAAVLGAHRSGRVSPIVQGESIAGRTISFVTNYGQLEGNYMESPPSRLPGRDEIYNPQRVTPN